MGFWRGVSASYWGVSETIAYFVIYEHLKLKLATYRNKPKNSRYLTPLDYFGYFHCGAFSRVGATMLTYPHGEIINLAKASRLIE